MWFEAFGLIWRSAHALPFRQLPDAPARPIDIDLVVVDQQPVGAPHDDNSRQLLRDANGWTLRFRGTDGQWGDFRFDMATRTLTMTTSRPAEQCWSAVEGLVPGIILHDRGELILHGSALMIGDRSVAILGPSGAGKSTLAAHLVRRGAILLTDDLIAFDKDCGFATLPGSLRLGLLPDAADGMNGDSMKRDGRRLLEDKHLFWVDKVAQARAPLAAIYVLAPTGGQELALEPATGLDAVMSLRQNIYGDWIGPQTAEAARSLLHLAQTAKLFTLRRPRDLGRMDEGCALIEAGCRDLPLARAGDRVA